MDRQNKVVEKHIFNIFGKIGATQVYLDVSMAQLCFFILQLNLDFGEATENEYFTKL